MIDSAELKHELLWREELPCDGRCEGSYEQRAAGLRASGGSRAKQGAFDARQSVTAARQWRTMDGDTASVFRTTGLNCHYRTAAGKWGRSVKLKCYVYATGYVAAAFRLAVVTFL